MNEAMKKALKRVDAAKLPLVQPLIDRSWEIYAKSVKLGIDLDAQREKEKEKKAAKEKAKADGQPDTKTESSTKEENPDEPGLKTHALVMWGNVIFEQVTLHHSRHLLIVFSVSESDSRSDWRGLETIVG